MLTPMKANVVTASPANAGRLAAIFKGLPCAPIGRVTRRKTLRVRDDAGQDLINAELGGLRQAFKQTLQGL